MTLKKSLFFWYVIMIAFTLSGCTKKNKPKAKREKIERLDSRNIATFPKY